MARADRVPKRASKQSNSMHCMCAFVGQVTLYTIKQLQR